MNHHQRHFYNAVKQFFIPPPSSRYEREVTFIVPVFQRIFLSAIVRITRLLKSKSIPPTEAVRYISTPTPWSTIDPMSPWYGHASPMLWLQYFSAGQMKKHVQAALQPTSFVHTMWNKVFDFFQIIHFAFSRFYVMACYIQRRQPISRSTYANKKLFCGRFLFGI